MPTNNLETALLHASRNREKAVQDLRELLAIPSVSTLPEHQPDMRRAAEWILRRLSRLGFDTRIIPGFGHPLVFAERMKVSGAPTLLIYGHYDVQPAEPLEEWNSKPFEAEIRGENLFGRGASDMKGPLTAYLAAVEAVVAAEPAPLNFKFLLEGEEEVGSPHLESFLKAHGDLVRCDTVLNGDTMILGPDLPALVYGLRGLAYFELRLETAGHDLHSGVYGGAVPNAGQILCELIAGMHDSEGRVTLPGFYADVTPLDAEEREELSRIPFEEEKFLAESTGRAINGEAGYTVTERVSARPTLEVNGLLAGFTGEGSKTVLPARAMAKISMRLVPDQTAARVRTQLEDYLRGRAPAWLKWELIDLAGGPAAVVSRNTPEMQAAVRALEAAFGARPVFAREGGSVPVVSLMQSMLGKESIMMGMSLPDDNLHAPNEKLHLPTFYRAIEAYIRFFYELAA